MDKEETINFLLNYLMDALIETKLHPDVATSYAIEACLRFASRAALLTDVSLDELKDLLKEQWLLNKGDIKNKLN